MFEDYLSVLDLSSTTNMIRRANNSRSSSKQMLKFASFFALLSTILSMLFLYYLPRFSADGTKVAVGVCPDGSTTCGGYDWKTYIDAILVYAKNLGAALVILLIIYAGYVYVTSAGDSAKLTSAKDRVVGALLGYVLLVLATTLKKYIGLT